MHNVSRSSAILLKQSQLQYKASLTRLKDDNIETKHLTQLNSATKSYSEQDGKPRPYRQFKY